MSKTLVAYHSFSGNNRFLAEKIATLLEADLQPIQPRFKHPGILYLLSLLKWRSGIRIDAAQLEPYDEVVMLGPVWGGLLIAPLRDLIRQCKQTGKPFHFATCCGSADEQKNDRYGYEQVLEAVRQLGGELAKSCEALPVGLVLPAGTNPEDKELMELRLNDDNYPGAMEERLRSFVEKMSPVSA